ncbi:MAG: bZIP transcription factor [Waterburya sp.]
MKNNFWSLIWSSFNEIQGSLITFIGIFVSILLARYPVKTQISLDVFIIVILILLLIIATLTNAIGKLLTENKELKQRIAQPLIPKIIFTRKYQISEVEGILCLLERSQLFSIGIFVSCYYEDEGGIELLIGTGKVINVQGDGKIQAFIDRPVMGYENILNELSNKDSPIIPRVIIKPTISIDIT